MATICSSKPPIESMNMYITMKSMYSFTKCFGSSTIGCAKSIPSFYAHFVMRLLVLATTRKKGAMQTNPHDDERFVLGRTLMRLTSVKGRLSKIDVSSSMIP